MSTHDGVIPQGYCVAPCPVQTTCAASTACRQMTWTLKSSLQHVQDAAGKGETTQPDLEPCPLCTNCVARASMSAVCWCVLHGGSCQVVGFLSPSSSCHQCTWHGPTMLRDVAWAARCTCFGRANHRLDLDDVELPENHPWATRKPVSGAVAHIQSVSTCVLGLMDSPSSCAA